LEASRHVPLDTELLNLLGNAFNAIGEFEKAEESYLKGITLAKEDHDQSTQRMILNNLGSNYNEWERYDQALAACREALEIARQLNNTYGQMRCHGNLGYIYISTGQPQIAEEEIWAAYKIWQSLDKQDQEYEADLLSSLGESYQLQGKLDQAKSNLDTAIHKYKELGKRREEALASWRLGKVVCQMGDVESARELMQKRIDYERSIQHTQTNKHQKEMNDLLKIIPRPT
jgi:tetratricopeptide (TPR) repeat protein